MKRRVLIEIETDDVVEAIRSYTEPDQVPGELWRELEFKEGNHLNLFSAVLHHFTGYKVDFSPTIYDEITFLAYRRIIVEDKMTSLRFVPEQASDWKAQTGMERAGFIAWTLVPQLRNLKL